MAERKKKPEKQNIHITIKGDVIGSNLTAGNQNQSAINSNLSTKQTPLPTYKKDSKLHSAGDLPLGSHLPFSPNALFTGREKELKDLAETLIPSPSPNDGRRESVVITQAVTGMGGLGKTQLAIEFGYRYGKYFRGVHWINLADPSQLDSEIANCGRQIFTNDFPEDQPSQVALTLKTWKEVGPNLLILDNFEEPSIANDVLTKLRHSNIRILVTSRRTDWSQNLGLTQLPLDLFSPEESLQFLKDSLKSRKDTEEDLKNLAERLGHLPLGLELTSRYLNGHARLSISEYLKQTENALDHPSMKNWRADMPAATGHDLDLQKTFALSWQETKDETAKKIFMMAGYLAPNTPIPLEIFEHALKISQNECDETLNLLYGLGLLRKGEDGLPTIHPLLAQYVRFLEKEDNKILEILTHASAVYATKINNHGVPTSYLPLKPHITIMAGYCESVGLKGTTALLVNHGYHLREIADYLGARDIFERALKIDETNFGPDHSEVAIDVNNLGYVMQDLGDLNGAKEMHERALEIDEANFGADHPNVAIDVNNLGNVMQELGDLDGAKEMFERALKINEAKFGSDHPNVATNVNNLGYVMQDLGDLKGAREMYERALKIFEANLGKEHPQVATVVNNLGNAMGTLGDLNGAKAMYERALKIDEVIFGKDHPDVAIDINNLGNVMQELGDLDGAKEMFERALKIDETSFGKDHPSVAYRVNNLGSVMHELGDLNGARELYERALEIFKKFLPADHPNIKLVQKNLDFLNKSK